MKRFGLGRAAALREELRQLLVGALPAAGLDGEECIAAWRALYPVAIGNVIMVTGGWRAVRGLGRMHDAIRDSMYLVGRRLHNLE